MKGKTYHVRCWGEIGAFNPGGFRVERVSNTIPSHGGAVGILSSIMGKPEISWQVTEIRLLKVPRRMALIENEFTSMATPDRPPSGRTQRTQVFLRDIDMIISGHFTLSPRSDRPTNTIGKYEDMMDKRLYRGRFHRIPVFGRSGCDANFEQVRDLRQFPAVDYNEDLGLSYYDRDTYAENRPEYFAPLSIVKGICTYPSWDAVRAMGICRQQAKSA